MRALSSSLATTVSKRSDISCGMQLDVLAFSNNLVTHIDTTMYNILDLQADAHFTPR
jgi:hypothetical protein